MTVKEPTGRLARWALLLQEFDIEITYRPGKTNQNADCLSRIPVNNSDDHPLSGEPVPIFFITRDFEAEQNKDSYCKNARNRVESANQRHAANIIYKIKFSLSFSAMFNDTPTLLFIIIKI